MEKAFELTGDYSKNISGKDVYYIHGEDIRNQKNRKINKNEKINFCHR